MLEESNQRVERKLERIMTMLEETLSMATTVHQEQVDTNVDIGTLKAKVAALEAWRAKVEAQMGVTQ